MMKSHWIQEVKTWKTIEWAAILLGVLSFVLVVQGLMGLYVQQSQVREWEKKATPVARELLAKVDADRIMREHLFGLAPASATGNISISQLNWVVQGIALVFPKIEQSRVLLKINQTSKWYKIGDELPQNVEIYGINQDHIVLKRNGDYETLYFQRKSLQFSKPPTRGGSLR